jgi:hypothetical protein
MHAYIKANWRADDRKGTWTGSLLPCSRMKNLGGCVAGFLFFFLLCTTSSVLTMTICGKSAATKSPVTNSKCHPSFFFSVCLYVGLCACACARITKHNKTIQLQPKLNTTVNFEQDAPVSSGANSLGVFRFALRSSLSARISRISILRASLSSRSSCGSC